MADKLAKKVAEIEAELARKKAEDAKHAEKMKHHQDMMNLLSELSDQNQKSLELQAKILEKVANEKEVVIPAPVVNVDIPKEVEVKKPKWYENLSIQPVVSAIASLPNLIWSSRLEKGSPETRQYVVLVDELGNPISLQKLLEPIISALRGIQNQPQQRTMSRSGGVNMVYNEVPSGTVDGSNTDFILIDVPLSGTLQVYVNGARMKLNEDFTLSLKTISFITAPPIGSIILVDYQK